MKLMGSNEEYVVFIRGYSIGSMSVSSFLKLQDRLDEELASKYFMRIWTRNKDTRDNEMIERNKERW